MNELSAVSYRLSAIGPLKADRFCHAFTVGGGYVEMIELRASFAGVIAERHSDRGGAGSMKRTTTIIIVVAALLVPVIGILVIRQVAARNDFSMGLCDHISPLLVSSSAIARNLDRDRGDLVYDSLYILTERKDPIAVDRAIELLHVENDYTWLNAAHYLGACGRKEAVPYLIKAFRHTAWRSDQERAQYLRNLTGKDFGVDFDKWKAWWEQTHPNSSIDWESCLGSDPRLRK